MREIPILHHNQQVHHENSTGQQSPRQFCGRYKAHVDAIPVNDVRQDDSDDQRGNGEGTRPEDDDSSSSVLVPVETQWTGPVWIEIVLQHHVSDHPGGRKICIEFKRNEYIDSPESQQTNLPPNHVPQAAIFMKLS